jgi:hypothetical protein
MSGAVMSGASSGGAVRVWSWDAGGVACPRYGAVRMRARCAQHDVTGSVFVVYA